MHNILKSKKGTSLIEVMVAILEVRRVKSRQL
jgi:hypothetical protein